MAMGDANHLREKEQEEYDALGVVLEILDDLSADYGKAYHKIKELEEDLAWAFHQYPELANDVHFKDRYTYLGAAPGVDARAAPVYVPPESPDAPAAPTRTKTGE